MKHSLDAKIKIHIYSALFFQIRNVVDFFRIWNREAISSQHHQYVILLDNAYHFG